MKIYFNKVCCYNIMYRRVALQIINISTNLISCQLKRIMASWIFSVFNLFIKFFLMVCIHIFLLSSGLRWIGMRVPHFMILSFRFTSKFFPPLSYTPKNLPPTFRSAPMPLYTFLCK